MQKQRNQQDPILNFTIFCLENYKLSHHYPGAEAADLFNKFGIFHYLKQNYAVLHSLGEKALVQDIDLYISARRANA